MRMMPQHLYAVKAMIVEALFFCKSEKKVFVIGDVVEVRIAEGERDYGQSR